MSQQTDFSKGVAEKSLQEDCGPKLSGEGKFAQVTVLERFRGAVLKHSDAIAVQQGNQTRTYAELWNQAAAIYERLVREGVQPGEPVGIAADRSIATIAAILGVVMAGGCYVPVEWNELSSTLRERLLSTNGPRIWIVDAPARNALTGLVAEDHVVVALEEIAEKASAEPVEIAAVPLQGESPLYVMFTSGSTGVPKGVVIPHRAVVRLVSGQNFMQFGPQRTFLLHSPLSFDASTLELWGSLLHGSRLVLAPAGKLGLQELTATIMQQGVDTLWLTAALFHLAAEHAPEIFAALNQLLFGGDVIEPRHVERIRRLYPGLHMVNGYGPTENTTFTCCYVVPREYRAEGSLPIGVPLAQTTITIVDENGKPVATGETGELVTAGAGIALGYLGDAAATAAKFIPVGEGQALAYRTGDRVRQRQDGVLEFLGRVDRQVKIAGHRVELEAVEAVLSGSSQIQAAAVMALPNASREKQLVAYVAVQGASEAQHSTIEMKLRQQLNEKLGRVAVPQRWRFVQHLPVTPNGKLDRAAIERQWSEETASPATPKPSSIQPQELGSVGSLNEHQIRQWIQQLWARLLGRPTVGLEENFFDLGGTSLLLIEMHARLRAQFPEVPSLIDLFAYPTPHQLAARLYAGRNAWREKAEMEQRGQRQRAAMEARRSATRISAAPATRKDGTR